MLLLPLVSLQAGCLLTFHPNALLSVLSIAAAAA
jgi:hypothetical protein